ncbi:MAG: hypothetical protein DYG89_49805 [Caldilinea sp. CFX5]|nr:hypothetical protein [Caldilinea sp. CFX5]
MDPEAFRTPEATNKIFYLHGPEAMSQQAALARYCQIVHPAAQVGSMPLWLGAIIARLSGNKELQAILPFFRYAEKVAEGGDPSEANRILGAPTLTLAAWSQQQQEAL